MYDKSLAGSKLSEPSWLRLRHTGGWRLGDDDVSTVCAPPQQQRQRKHKAETVTVTHVTHMPYAAGTPEGVNKKLKLEKAACHIKRRASANHEKCLLSCAFSTRRADKDKKKMKISNPSLSDCLRKHADAEKAQQHVGPCPRLEANPFCLRNKPARSGFWFLV